MFTKITIISVMIVYVLSQTQPPFPDKTTDTFQNASLLAHNQDRALHINTGNLTIDPNIIAYAKTRCNTTSQYSGLTHGHTGLSALYGENLWYVASSNNLVVTGAMALVAWYNNEEPKYNYSSPGFSEATGHFTQVVWASTTRVGCATCGGKGATYWENYVVCNYQTPGNNGGYSSNVQPLKSSG